MWTALDADTKVIVSYVLGIAGPLPQKVSCVTWRGESPTAHSTHKMVTVSTPIAVEGAFEADIDYATLGNIYGASKDNPESRYSPATCIGCRTGVLNGDPDPDRISTSFVEPSNLSMRMGMGHFTQLKNGSSKKVENHGPMVALWVMHYNYCRVQKTLRVTPAMEAGLTEHVWEIEALRRRSFHDVVDGMSLRRYCFNEAVLGSCAGRGFVLLAAGAFLVEGLLTLLPCCSCFWSFLPAVCLADTGFTCAVLA